MSTRSVWAFVLAAALVPAARAEEPKKEPPAPTFKAPKGWEKLEPTQFTTARFRAGEGDKAVTVTLVVLGGEGGGLAANVNRWRAQVGLKELGDEAAVQALQAVKVDGKTGHLLDVTGPDVAGKATQRIVAAMVTRDGQTWFVKMGGAAGPVGDQKAAFDEFVKSIRFEKK